MASLPEFTIVGSGLAGALLACALGRQGHRVHLFEKRWDPRSKAAVGGKSINLALSVRGLHALNELGLAELVKSSAVKMPGRMIHARDQTTTFQPYGNGPDEVLYSVSRGGLNRTLIETAAKLPNVELTFDRRCTSVDVKTGQLEFVDDATGQTTTVETQCIIGADGAHSAVRSAMQKMDRYELSQSYLSHGYKELSIPAGPDGRHVLEPNALHIWPRRKFMMIALPNSDGTFTGTLFWPFDGPDSFAALNSDGEVVDYFRHQFPDVVPLIPDLGRQYMTNPTSSLVTIRCRPWVVSDRIAPVGDACHAVVPFLGQGMNAAFEDCEVLLDSMKQNPTNRARAFSDYESKRKPNADVLADLCVENFIEMRDKVASPLFVWWKKLSLWIAKLFPSWYRPLYTMIEFSRIPYAEALQRSQRQDAVIRGAGIGLLLALALGTWGCLSGR